MVAHPPATGYTWPQPTDIVVVGFNDLSFQQIRAMRRTAIGGLIAYDGMIVIGYELDGVTPITQYAFGVAVADSADDGYGIMVAAFSEQGERRQYIIDNAEAWLT